MPRTTPNDLPRRALLVSIVAAAALLLGGAVAQGATVRLDVVATTGHIGDAIANVAPDLDVFVLDRKSVV